MRVNKYILVMLLCCFLHNNLYADNHLSNDTIVDGKTIQEVVVQGREIVVKDDKLVINVSNKIKKYSHDGYSALSLLSIPGLSVDPIDEAVSTNGKATMLCINGREVSKNEIKTLYPKDILRIDYYQQFDPNHPEATSVIDFIMKVRDSGGMVMAQANQNLNRAMGNDMLDWKTFKNKSQFNIQVTDKYDHFTPSRGTESYTLMPFASGDVEKILSTKPSRIHNNSIGTKLAYLYSGKTSTLEIAATLRNSHNANTTWLEQTITDMGNFNTRDYRHNDNITPGMKVYYQKKFNKKLSLRANISGSYNHTKQWRDYYAIESYQSHTKEDFYTVNPSISVIYNSSKRIDLVMYALYHFTHSNSTYTENKNLTENKLTEGQAIIMPACRIEIIPKKFRVTLQAQERIQTIDAGDKSYTKTYLTPSLIYHATLAKNTNLYGAFFSGVNSPEMKYYTSGEKRIDEFQVITGNNDLKMGRMYTTEISLNSYYKWGSFQIYSRYDNNQKNIYENIYCDENRHLYVHHYLNGGAYEHFSIYSQLDFNLIKDKLKWNCSGQYSHKKQRIGYLQTLNVWNANSWLTYYDKGWQCKIEYATRRKSLTSTGAIATHPQSLKVSVGYTMGNWSFNLYTKNPLMKSSLNHELYRNGYTAITDNYKPRTDYNMFAMRVSYRFIYGKKHNYKDVQIDEGGGSAILDTDTK